MLREQGVAYRLQSESSILMATTPLQHNLPVSNLQQLLWTDSPDSNSGLLGQGKMVFGQEAVRETLLCDQWEWWDSRSSKKNPTSPALEFPSLQLGNKSRASRESRGTPRGGSMSPAGCKKYDGDLQGRSWGSLHQDGHLTEAVEAVALLVQRRCYVDKFALYGILKGCIAQNDLALGSYVHSLVVKCGYESNAFLANHLICMYASHKRLEDAMWVFTQVPEPNVHMWASIILAHAQHGQPTEAVNLYQQMRESPVKPDNHIFVAVLKACATASNLAAGRGVHADILRNAEMPNIFVGNSLVGMYSKCGSLEDARRVFDTLPAKDAVSWNAMITGYVQNGLGEDALSLYGSMQQEGVTPPNAVTFVSLLQACASITALQQGKSLHAQIQQSGFEDVAVVSTCLVDMYAKCGSLADARRVFDNLSNKNVVTWTAMIAGYVQQGHGEEALALYGIMQQEATVSPNAVTFVCLLQACASLVDLDQGKQLHTQIQDKGLATDVVVGTCLVDMYAKCGSIVDACKVFENLPIKSVATWNAMIGGYAQHGLGQQALTVYTSMQREAVTPDAVTFVCILHACASVGTLHEGKLLHAQIVERGLEANLVVGNCLIDMYAKCGSLADARSVFDNLPSTNVVSWNTMITGYVQHGLGESALGLYSSMHLPGDHVTFVCLLQACADVGVLSMGKLLHAQIRERGLETHGAVARCLVGMYASCGSLEDARRLFDSLPTKNVVLWNTMIGGYVLHGLGEEALALYACMPSDSLIAADGVTFCCLLQACASIGALHYGKQLHKLINAAELEADGVVSSCLLNMYAKCGSLEEARRVFDRLPIQNVVTWNAMIAAYAQKGFGQEALALYASMQLAGITRADRLTFLSLLQACASVGALQTGKQLHAQIQASGLEADVLIGSSLVDMYGKCGTLEEARRVFDRLPAKNVVTWNAMLTGYAQHCDGRGAIRCFDEMSRHGVKPDGTTFTCLLVACSHAALVHEGQRCFRTMVENHGICPTAHHYNCMVDLLGRSGRLDEAETLLHTMPFENESVGWTSLLSACKSQGDVERGKRCFDRLTLVEPENAAAYVMLGSMYAKAGRLMDVIRMERLRKSAGAWKKPARACIETKNKVHEFVVGEDRTDISNKLQGMRVKLQEGGHVPQTELVLKAGSDKEKEDALCGHAEKLALAYGLLNTPDGTTLLVTKNLRMCNDCHSSTKVLSLLERRQIVVRDAHRVHRFVDGSCSCGDRH